MQSPPNFKKGYKVNWPNEHVSIIFLQFLGLSLLSVLIQGPNKECPKLISSNQIALVQQQTCHDYGLISKPIPIALIYSFDAGFLNNQPKKYKKTESE